MRVFVPEPKVRDYLLKDPRKSGFFLRVGYSDLNWARLRDDLLMIGQTFQPDRVEDSRHGKRLEIIGELTAPDGRLIKITTGWMILIDDTETIRFVTAYPT